MFGRYRATCTFPHSTTPQPHPHLTPPQVTSWLATRVKDGPVIKTFFDKYVQQTLDFIRKECKPKMSIADMSLLTTMTTLIDSMLKDLTDTPSEAALERFILYSLMWSLAGVIESSDRTKVDKMLRTLCTNNLPEVEHPDTIYEYRVDDSTQEYAWANWGSVLPKWEFKGFDLAKEFASLLIPTIDSVRTEHNIGLSIKMNRPVILVGGPGTAKTSIILQVIEKADPALISVKKLSFSAATSPSILQRQIESSVEKRQGKTFGPPGGKKM